MKLTSFDQSMGWVLFFFLNVSCNRLKQSMNHLANRYCDCSNSRFGLHWERLDQPFNDCLPSIGHSSWSRKQSNELRSMLSMSPSSNNWLDSQPKTVWPWTSRLYSSNHARFFFGCGRKRMCSDRFRQMKVPIIFYFIICSPGKPPRRQRPSKNKMSQFI